MPTWSDTTVSAGRSYSYRVKAVNDAGSSAYTATATVSTPQAPEPSSEGIPAAPAVLGGAGTAQRSIAARQAVSLLSTAAVYYTLAGSLPRPGLSPLYGGTLNLSGNVTLIAVAVDADGDASPPTVIRFLRRRPLSPVPAFDPYALAVAPAAVTVTPDATPAPAAPLIGGLADPGPRPFLNRIAVPLTAAAGTAIRFTTDGSDPRNSPTAQTYAAPIVLSTNTRLRAVAVQSGRVGAEAFAHYIRRGGRIPPRPIDVYA